jgi:hypothetical protein
MTTSTQTTQPNLFAPAIPLMSNGQKFAFAVTRVQGHAVTGMMRYQIEALDFLKQRCEQDVKLVDDLIASEDVNKAFDIYAGWVEKAIGDYSAQAGKVASISSDLASETAKLMQKEAETITKDVTAPREKEKKDVAAASEKKAEAATA